jgi:putative transcriptional regulator
MSKHRCARCGRQDKARVEDAYRYSACGLDYIFLAGVRVFECACGERDVEIPAVEELHDLIADDLARKRRKLAPSEIRFLRVHLGFSSEDFGRVISVAPETVSRWEHGRQPMRGTYEKILRLMVLAKREPFRDYDVLASFASVPARVPRERAFRRYRDRWSAPRVAGVGASQA